MAEYVPYWQKLQDPRWQRKRLEILERDGWACVQCGDTATTLNVHHGCYVKGIEPWECQSGLLWTLCKTCHERVTLLVSRIHLLIGYTHPADLSKLAGEMMPGFRERIAQRTEAKSEPLAEPI